METEKEIIKGHCIICHQDDVELSDEHVIPDAIGGYIHCYRVCTECNSHLGDHVDAHLLNHYLIKGARYVHKLKGKKGAIPNPLTGDGVLNTGEKVRVEDVNGVSTPRILPQSPEIAEDKKSGKITVDVKDEKLIPAMQQKMLKKMGVKPEDVTIVSHREVHQIAKPVVQLQAMVDLKKYKIGLLKIAYETCVEMFPDYENDPIGKKYAEILYQVAFEIPDTINRLDEVKFEGNGFQDPLEPLLSQFLDYDNKKRHLIVLFNHSGHLCCLVKVFDIFTQYIQMSDSAYLNEGDMRIYVNDFSKHGYEQLTLTELISKQIEEKYTGYKFDEKGMSLLNSIPSCEEVGFHANKFGQNLVYNENGTAIMTEEMLKESLLEDCITDSSLIGGEFTTTYHIPEGFYFCASPVEALVQLREIVETSKINKY